MSTEQEQPAKDWKIFKGDRIPHNDINDLPDPPDWRSFGRPKKKEEVNKIKFVEVSLNGTEKDRLRGETFRLPQNKAGTELLNLVNAAIYLRRPLLITGNPGTGKTSLAYAIAHELTLGSVLVWPITARSTLKEGLYQYDAIARIQEAQTQQLQREVAITQKGKMDAVKFKNIPIGNYFTLGPLGTAFLPHQRPRVLLIDEVDKSDINLPNDLLNLFEEGEYKIPELARLTNPNFAEEDSQQIDRATEVQTCDNSTAAIENGRVRCYEFPIIIMTSNGERDFPPAFMRRCLRIEMSDPTEEALTEIVQSHLKGVSAAKIQQLVGEFVKRKNGVLAPDQLLNVVYLLTRQFSLSEIDEKTLIEQLLQYLE